jgi:hypothetical protein
LALIAIATAAHALPDITVVNGCSLDSDNYTLFCPTTGNVALTIRGTSFGGEGAQAFVGGRACPVAAATDTEIVCDLPVGAGTGVDVVVVDSSGTPSMPKGYVGYSPPEITSVAGCTDNALGSTEDCARSGGNVITINGTNFGPLGSVRTVLVGSDVCPFSTENATDTSVICNLRQGRGTAKTVLVQSVDQLSPATGASVSYAQCPPGTREDDATANCLACDDGTVSNTYDADTCDACPAGTVASADQTSCTGATDLQCWSVKDASEDRFTAIEGFSIVDELATGQVDLKKPALYCTAADTGATGASPPDVQTCCYQAKGSKLAVAHQALTQDDIGGARTLSVVQPKFVCTSCTSSVTTP